MAVRFIAAVAITMLLVVGVSRAQDAEEYRLAITEISGAEALETSYRAFADALSEFTGLEFVLYPVDGSINAVVSMEHGLVDFVLTGPAEYIHFAAEAKGTPVFGITRPDLYSMIVTLANSGISSLPELEHKTVAFRQQESLTGHLQPIYMLKYSGREPVTVKEEFMSAEDGFEKLVNGDVQAWAGSSSDFWVLSEREEYKPSGRYRILARGADRPGDVMIASQNVPQSVRRRVKNAVEDHGPALLEALLSWEGNGKYYDSRFFTDIEDENFNEVREMYLAAGFTRLVARSISTP